MGGSGKSPSGGAQSFRGKSIASIAVSLVILLLLSYLFIGYLFLPLSRSAGHVNAVMCSRLADETYLSAGLYPGGHVPLLQLPSSNVMVVLVVVPLPLRLNLLLWAYAKQQRSRSYSTKPPSSFDRALKSVGIDLR